MTETSYTVRSQGWLNLLVYPCISFFSSNINFRWYCIFFNTHSFTWIVVRIVDRSVVLCFTVTWWTGFPLWIVLEIIVVDGFVFYNCHMFRNRLTNISVFFFGIKNVLKCCWSHPGRQCKMITLLFRCQHLCTSVVYAWSVTILKCDAARYIRNVSHAHRIAKASLSVWLYLCSTGVRALLTYVTDLNCPSKEWASYSGLLKVTAPRK